MDLGLTVIQDDQDHRKVLITNLPFEAPGTDAGEKIAGDVARIARIIRSRRSQG